MATTQTASLLSLPPELRLQIYAYTFPDTDKPCYTFPPHRCKIRFCKRCTRALEPTALLQTSRLLRLEVNDAFYTWLKAIWLKLDEEDARWNEVGYEEDTMHLELTQLPLFRGRGITISTATCFVERLMERRLSWASYLKRSDK